MRSLPILEDEEDDDDGGGGGGDDDDDDDDDDVGVLRINIFSGRSVTL